MARVLLAAQLRRTALILTILLATLQSSVATAAEYPSRVVSLVVAFPAGGGVDTVGRAIAQKLGEALGQQVIVVNRPGAGSVIGTRDVARGSRTATRCCCWSQGPPFQPIRDTTWKGISRRSA